MLKGVLDAGLEISHSKDVLPADNVVKGENIAKYFKSIDRNNSMFSKYKKENINALELSKVVEEIKKKILEGK